MITALLSLDLTPLRVDRNGVVCDTDRIRDILHVVDRSSVPRMSIDVKLFEAWLRRKGLVSKTIRGYVSYFTRLGIYTCSFEDLRAAALKARNRWEIKTLRHVVNLCWELGHLSFEDRFRLLSLLKVGNSRSFRLYRISSVKIPHLGVVGTIYRLLVFSGARLSEAVKVVNEFDSSRLVCFDSFCRYHLAWYRGKKRCEWIYAPIYIWREVASLRCRVNEASVSSYARKKGYTRPKDLRKVHYRICIDTLRDRDLCDFYQSRSLSVGAKHYDLILERADKYYPQLMKVLEKILATGRVSDSEVL